MYVLDTDTLSGFLRGNARLREKILATDPALLWVSVVTVEELLTGRLAAIRAERQKRRRGIDAAYADLTELLSDLRDLQLLPFTTEAEQRFQALPPAVKRAGSQDCRIAASALIFSYRVVTANVRHFSQIPGFVLEDWTA